MTSQSPVTLSHMNREDLMNLRRHLRAMLILVEQLLQFSLTGDDRPAKG